MALGTLIASIVAAVAGIAGVVVALWQRWPRLALSYAGGFRVEARRVIFTFRLENRGAAAIHQIELSVVGPGDTFSPTAGNVGTFALQPWEIQDVDCPVAKPERVDIAPNEPAPTLKVPVTVFAYYGRRAKRVTLPAGLVWPPAHSR